MGLGHLILYGMNDFVKDSICKFTRYRSQVLLKVIIEFLLTETACEQIFVCQRVCINAGVGIREDARALSHLTDFEHVEDVLSLALRDKLAHADRAPEFELKQEVLNDGWSSLGPLHQELVVVASIRGRVITGVQGQKREGDVDKDRNYALQLLL